MTASGSAISGWALWTEAHFRVVWTFLAGTAAVLAIAHATLGVADRLKDQGEMKRRFSGLRTDLETFRDRMRVSRNFDVNEFSKEFAELRRRYSEAVELLKNDPLETKTSDDCRQKELNERLGEMIEEPKPK